MARLKEIVVDAWQPPVLARYWESVLDDFRIAPYDMDEIDRLAAMGRAPDTDPSVSLDGLGIRIFFQEPEREMERQGGIHFDIVGAVRDLEVERLITLGATVQSVHREYTKMQDPEGNEFCVQDPPAKP